MKTTTITKFETSDGREFKDMMDARGHEVCLLADKLRSDPNKRLTAVQLVQVMCEHPNAFASLLLDLDGGSESGEQAKAAPVFQSQRTKAEEPVTPEGTPDGEE